MKDSLKCPKCDHRKLWLIEKFKTRGPYEEHCVLPVVATSYSVWSGNSYEGYFDIFVCAQCGYTESYARDIENLKRDPKRGIFLVDGSLPDGGPFR